MAVTDWSCQKDIRPVGSPPAFFHWPVDWCQIECCWEYISCTQRWVSPAVLLLSGVGSAQIHRPQSIFPEWRHGYYITEEQDVWDLQRSPTDLHATRLRFTHRPESDQFQWWLKVFTTQHNVPGCKSYAEGPPVKIHTSYPDRFLYPLSKMSPGCLWRNEETLWLWWWPLGPHCMPVSCHSDRCLCFLSWEYCHVWSTQQMLTVSKPSMTSGGDCLLWPLMKTLKQWLWMNSGTTSPLWRTLGQEGCSGTWESLPLMH